MATVTTLSLDVPGEILASLRLSPEQAEEELKKDLAVALYARGALTFAEARALTELDRRGFDELFGGAPRPPAIRRRRSVRGSGVCRQRSLMPPR